MNKKKLAIAALSMMLVIPGGTSALAEESTATAELIESVGFTAEDMEAAAYNYKFTGGNDSEETYSRLYKFGTVGAELGSCECMLWVGELYQAERVEGVEGDEAVQKALEYWERSGDAGQPQGYTNIGLIYLHKSIPGGSDNFGDVAYDTEKGLEWLNKAREAGCYKAPRYLAKCYEAGEGVEEDLEKAFELYQEAAALGDSTANNIVAQYMMEGKGVEQDVEGAMAIYQAIIDEDGHDTPAAAYALGQMYENGEYVEQDLEKAKAYYQITVDKAFSADMQSALDGATEALERLG